MAIEQIRLVLLAALAVVGFLLWQAWERDYGPMHARAPTHAAAPAEHAPSPLHAPSSPSQKSAAAPSSTAGTDVPVAPEGAASATKTAPAPAVPAQQAQTPAAGAKPAIVVRTDVLAVWIDLVGGEFRRAELLRYPVSTQQPHTPFRLLEQTPGNEFVAQSGLIGPRDAPTHHARFEASAEHYRLEPGTNTLEVPLVWHGPDGVTVTKTYVFHRDRYLVDLHVKVANRSGAPWTGRLYGQFTRSDPGRPHGLFHTYTYTGGVVSGPDKPYEKISFSTMGKENLSRAVKGGWVAMIEHYFAGAWIPAQGTEDHFYTKALGDKRYVIGLITPAKTVAPGASGELSLSMYVGPKDQKRLQKAAPHLERTVDYGWLWMIAEPIFGALSWLHGVLGNWGWSIIVLTCAIKLAFFHLSATSYKSMARMRKLQPRIQALRDRYAGDRQRMNQAMMELYKTEKINPLGGCLPIVVQIPVFISLYWVLLESIELRQASFIFWLHDLSVYDPYFVLPVLMGTTMLVQQKLNPTPPDPLQAKVMMALPFVFTFFFLFFPSGLVLYWFVNNCLSIAQQWVITRKIVGTK